MTEKDTIECIEELKQYNRNGELITPVNNGVSMVWDGAFGITLDLFQELQAYRAIGIVEEFKALKEKNEPLEVKEIHVDEYYCPACGSENSCDNKNVRDKFCSECGQALFVKDVN